MKEYWFNYEMTSADWTIISSKPSLETAQNVHVVMLRQWPTSRENVKLTQIWEKSPDASYFNIQTLMNFLAIISWKK